MCLNIGLLFLKLGWGAGVFIKLMETWERGAGYLKIAWVHGGWRFFYKIACKLDRHLLNPCPHVSVTCRLFIINQQPTFLQSKPFPPKAILKMPSQCNYRIPSNITPTSNKAPLSKIKKSNHGYGCFGLFVETIFLDWDLWKIEPRGLY